MALNAPAAPPSSAPLPPAAPSPGPQPPGPVRRRVLDRLYIAASSPQLTITLAVLLALTCAVAALLPQSPPGANLLDASRWLSTVSARYGRFGPFLASSGLLSVLAAPWTMALLGVCAFHLVLRAANQFRHLAARGAPIPPAPQGLPFELVHLPLAVDSVGEQLAALSAGRPSPHVPVSDATGARPRVDAYLERRRWAAAGPLLTYLGPLLVLLGLLWNTVAGWRVADVTLLPGRTVQPAQARGLALSLVDAGDGSRPGVVSLTRGSDTRHAWLGNARPATWGPVWIARRSSGPALSIRAAAGGDTLPLQALQGEGAPAESLHLRFGQNESEQGFTLPGRDLAFRVVSYESLGDRGIDRPVFLIEGYQGTDPTPRLNELVEDSKTIEWQGATVTLQREAYVVVDLSAMPGLPLLLLGALVLLAGVAVTAWGGATRTWLNAAAERDGTLLAVRAAAPALGQTEVASVAARLAALVPEGSPAPHAGRQVLRSAAYTVAGAFVLAGIAGVALRGANLILPRSQAWIPVLQGVLALLGLGAVAAGAVQSLWFALRGSRLSDVTDPMLRGPVQGLRGRAGDPGRGPSLAAFPLLTAALVLGSLWGLLASASPIRPVASEMWLLAAWLLAAAYLHATSGWRPLRVPAWLATVLLVAALAAGIAACLAAQSLLTL